MPLAPDTPEAVTQFPPTARMVSGVLASGAMGISPRMLAELESRGEAPRSVRVGRRRLYPIPAIEDWIRERSQTAE